MGETEDMHFSLVESFYYVFVSFFEQVFWLKITTKMSNISLSCDIQA